jgi:hypothetical protein
MKRTIRFGKGKFVGNTNAALQRAVDALAADGGGTLEIPAGKYRMNDSLHLRDNVTIIGEKGAVLQKVPSVISKLTLFVGYGHYEFAVEEPAKFRVGMGVHIYDKNAGGFYTTVATIVGRKGNLFYIDRPFSHDYLAGNDGQVASLYPLVSGYGARNAAVCGLSLDGNPKETRTLNGCRGGGVFLILSHGIRLENIEVTNYRGDGISFQQCTDISIRDCHVHHNTGGGLHPGSGSVRYVMRGNRLEHNGGCGIFYCLRTTHSLCEDNVIEHNGNVGISVGERDTDHIIRGNTIRAHGGAGIEIRKPLAQSGDRLWIERNRIENNCQKQGDAEITVAERTRDLCIMGNDIVPRRGKAILIGPRCARIHIVGNRVSGRNQRPQDVSGGEGSVRLTSPRNFPAVGPGAASHGAVRHLGIAKFLPA